MGLHRTQAPDLGTGRGPQMDTCGSTNSTDLIPRFAYGSPPTRRSQFRQTPIFNQGQAPELVYELVIDNRADCCGPIKASLRELGTSSHVGT